MMPIKSTDVDFTKVKIKEEPKSETELRKQALSQILKDSRLAIRVTGRVLFGIVFVYGIVSILQDVNLI
jgi:hypothetical protein